MDRHRHCCFGQTLAEYGLLVGLVGIVAIGGLSILAVQVDDTVTASGTHMSGGFFSPTVTGGGGVSGCTGSGGSQEGVGGGGSNTGFRSMPGPGINSPNTNDSGPGGC